MIGLGPEIIVSNMFSSNQTEDVLSEDFVLCALKKFNSHFTFMLIYISKMVISILVTNAEGQLLIFKFWN